MIQINAYLSLSGKCKEAMTFYKDCLGGELILQTVKDSPMATQWPATVQDQVLHGSLTKDHLVLLASDMEGMGKITKGTNISLSLNCSSAEELIEFFTKLSEGGTVNQPVHDFFAGKIAHLTDKFGINWIFYYDSSKKN